MSTSIVCPNPRCPQPSNVQRLVLSGTGSRSPDSARARSQRRTVNRRLMTPRTMFGQWGFAGGLSGLLILVGIYLMYFYLKYQGPSWQLIGGGAAWIVAVLLAAWSMYGHAHPGSSPVMRGRAEPKMPASADLYLCNGCGNVFEPVSGRFVPLDRAAELFA